MTILPDLSAKTNAQLVEMVKALQAKVDASKNKAISMKVSEKGALSVYGLQRWPVTLYASQWQRLLSHADAIKTFIQANADELTSKDD